MVRVRYSFGSRHTGKIKNIKKQREKFPEVVKKVIEISDIILEVLDARFINETRNKEIEELIRSKNKKIIYVINKSDLVNEKKTILPKDMRPFVFISCKTGRGSSNLRNKIKIEAKRVDLENKSRVQVGIIGYPNSGKSSLINLITRRGVARTSKQAGYTKGVQKVRLTESILILDTPGVIEESEYSSSDKRLSEKDTKIGARTFSDVKDPENVINYLMKNNSKEIEEFYNIKSNNNPEILIEELGRRKNFLLKGGEIDIDRTSRLMLKDWQEGKIKIK